MRFLYLILITLVVTSCISDCVTCGGEITPKGQRKIVRQAKRKERKLTRQQLKQKKKSTKVWVEPLN